jgi:endonuclease-3 related protein
MTISPKKLYEILLHTYGHQHWWPVDRSYHQNHNSDPRFEVMVGAILTQNTAWTNVEKALHNLKEHNTLTSHAIAHTKDNDLKTMIKPSGFFNQKAQRLKRFASYIHNQYHDDLHNFFSRDAAEIRSELLSLPGIGPETADSMLLYAGNHPLFVVDAYTKRLCQRLPYQVGNDSYESIQQFFETKLQRTIPEKDLLATYKEFHALLVEHAKRFCWKKKPNCVTCPLTRLCQKLL